MIPNMAGLIAFVEAARLGSLSAAARKLELTPAAVSRNVLKLEGELGVRLFNRSTRRLRLTAEGELFLVHAERALLGLDAAVAEVSAAGQAPVGKVRISVGASFGRHWIVPALPALIARYPGLRVEIDLENRPVDLVAEGFDIGIRGGFMRDSSLIARRICGLPVVLVASPDYLARHGVPQSVDALAAHAAIVVRFPSGTMSLWQFAAEDGVVDHLPEARILVSDPEAAVDLAVAGAGIAQAGIYHVAAYLRQGLLKVLLPERHLPGERQIVLHYPHRQYLAPRVRVTVDHLLEHCLAASDLHLSKADLAPWVA